jgi:hypothetical protein
MMIIGSSTWLVLFKLTTLIEENKILILGQVD